MNSVLALLIILAVLMAVVLVIANQAKPRMNKAYFLKRWSSIEASSNYSGAVLKADSLLNEALKRANVKGNTVGARLNNAVGILRDVNGTWSAHKLRNKIAHEHDSDPSEAQCKKALRQFKKALKDLGAL